MTTAELVKKLLEAIEAGDKPGAVAIAVQAVDEAKEEAQPRRRRRSRAKAAEVVDLRR